MNNLFYIFILLVCFSSCATSRYDKLPMEMADMSHPTHNSRINKLIIEGLDIPDDTKKIIWWQYIDYLTYNSRNDTIFLLQQETPDGLLAIMLWSNGDTLYFDNRGGSMMKKRSDYLYAFPDYMLKLVSRWKPVQITKDVFFDKPLVNCAIRIILKRGPKSIDYLDYYHIFDLEEAYPEIMELKEKGIIK